MTERRFIEEYFPVRRVGDESSREKSIRHGHISTLHIWWARRPLAASRATIYASLIPAPDDGKEAELRNLEIARLSKWENPIDKELVDKARRRILSNNNGSPPKVLDPFAGGGSIPLEALRLGCETYAVDYNPVSNLIVKATTEYPFQYKDQNSGLKSDTTTRLADNIKKWSKWVLEESRKELAELFPNEKEGEPVGYLWSRCITCPNPRCGATIPLIKQFWLANTKKKITLLPSIKGKKLLFSIAEYGKDKIPADFDPKKGTVERGKATCLVCGYRVEGNKIKALFAQEKNIEVMNVVIVKPIARSGKLYKNATENNMDIFKRASTQLKKKQRKFKKKYGINPIPDEPTPEGKGSGAERAFSVRLYHMNAWGDLFNNRQKLVMLTFLEKILEAAEIMEKENSRNMIKVLLYLGIILDRLADKDTTLCRWTANRETIANVFGRQALPIIWDYIEVNPFTSVGWPNMEEWVMRVLRHLEAIDAKPATVKHESATTLPFKNDFFDAVITDPPYYDNVPYSHLSDFFYVWLKRVLGTKMPELFSTPLTPKGQEIVAYSNGVGGQQGGKKFFEEMLGKSFQEIHRVLKPDGISVIVYAHKSTEGWETLINSLLRSGLVVTAAWPIHTEMKSRLRTKKSAALLSSIYMVCRKTKKEPVGFYRDVRRDLRFYLNKKLDQLWNEGISGADLFISAIGSAIEVYGKYDKVIDDRDREVSVLRMLEDTRTVVTNYAIDRVSHGELADRMSKMTRFYILWRWAHGEARVRFDEAKKLAQSVGIDLAEEWNTGFIRKEKEYIRVIGPDEREPEKLKDSDEPIDVLHHALWLWRKQRVDEANKFLETKGYKNSEVMRRVAQAISESLADSKGNKEKDWIDGMFTGAPRGLHRINQTKLF